MICNNSFQKKQPDQIRYIENMLKHIDHSPGFYIECGANDGIIQSYTLELEKIGWSGILIEPSEISFDKCLKNRSKNNYFYNCALIGSGNINEVYGDFNDGSPMASIGGVRLDRKEKQVAVNARTLNSILEELTITNIDLVSIDVEGYELEVLNGFDIEKYHPKYLIIETGLYCYDADAKNKIFDIMYKSGYDNLANLTEYNYTDNPGWDGSCNDYLFGRK